MLTEADRSKLAAAEILVREVRANLDGSHKTCECCGLKFYHNWHERNLAVRLNGIALKLHQVQEGFFAPASIQVEEETGIQGPVEP